LERVALVVSILDSFSFGFEFSLERLEGPMDDLSKERMAGTTVDFADPKFPASYDVILLSMIMHDCPSPYPAGRRYCSSKPVPTFHGSEPVTRRFPNNKRFSDTSFLPTTRTADNQRYGEKVIRTAISEVGKSDICRI
jgi:hypothetical protein